MEAAAALSDDFRCPISLEVMTDPVILPSGHTFERRSIQRWLDGGHLTCPVTNLPLPPSPPLIPNHALRRLISAISPPAPPPPAPEEKRPAAPPAASEEVCAMLRLAKSGPEGRKVVMESGDVAALLRWCAAGDETAARAVLHLSLDGDDARVGLVADGAVDALSAASREGRLELARIPGIVAVLAAVAGGGNARAIEQALVVLNWICGESGELAREAIKIGAFHLCEALVNDDNCKIAKNAVELARTLEKLLLGLKLLRNAPGGKLS
uniref:U-box domain-containing protein n=1 Tax=Leersia perrieri TaxID=77586 RepID=A0A0D9X485_9ORYZ